MRRQDIEVGQTYLFVATHIPQRKHLEGKPFTVTSIKKVWRSQTVSRRHQVWRVYNEDGVAARPEELGPLPERELPCDQCVLGEYRAQGTSPQGITNFECDHCGHRVSFP